MRVKIDKASDWRSPPIEREINTLDELLHLMNEYDDDIVIYRPRSGEDAYRITIYNDYLE